MIDFALFVLLGAACGFIGGLFGVGGALVTIPLLGIVFGYSEQAAQGTSLVMVVPNVLIALWRYFKRGSLDPRFALTISAAALPAVALTSWLATLVPSRHLRLGYAIFLLVMLLEYTRRSFFAKPGGGWRLPWPYVGLVGAVSGGLAGFFTVGGTLFAISANTFLFSLSQLEAQGLALAYSTPATMLSTVVYAQSGAVDWRIGIPLALGGMTTVSWAVDVAHRLPERWLRLLYIAFMVVSSALLLGKAIRTG